MNTDPLHAFRHAHLAGEPRRLGQAVGEVQHVELLVGRLLLDPPKVLVGEVDVAGGAGQSPLASAEPLRGVDLVVDEYVEEVVPLFPGCLSLLAGGLDVGEAHLLAGQERGQGGELVGPDADL